MAAAAPEDLAAGVLSTAFDPDFYTAVYTDLPPGLDPFWHYRVQGWRERRDPASWFSGHFYMLDNPDLKAGIDPFLHYLTQGRRQGRPIRPSHHAADWLARQDWSTAPYSFEALAAGAPTSPARQRAAVAQGFDARFYLAANPDVAASGMDPLAHFFITGWREGRDPAPDFSVRDYLEAWPDVAASGLNPFAHYMMAGRAEGRSARHDRGFRYDVIARLTPPADRIARAATLARDLAVGARADLARALGTLGDLHLTFSHDDYLAHAGGLQLSLRREAAAFAGRGAAHLHLHPQAPWQSVRVAGDPGPLGVMLDGRRLGVFQPADVAAALAAAAAGPGRRSFAIHSLLGHEPDETADIVAAAGLTAGVFWLHDFASLCAGFHLLRNDVADCAAPPPDSPACGVCAYGPLRARHTEAHRRLFDRLELTVAAPAQATLDLWQARSDLPARAAVVLPHARLVPRGPAPRPASGEPFRVGFLGLATPLKGWPLFRELAERLAGDPRYSFHHLGARPDPGAPVRFQPVTATPQQPYAMQDAAEALALDAAVVWPLCRETFSLTAYEACAAGAAVITGPDSGNVAAFVSESGLGRVLPEEAALFQAFESGAVLELGRARREAMLYDLDYSRLTADLTGKPA